jgi:predicted transcriptional regulator
LEQQSRQLKLERFQLDLDIGIAEADRGELLDADEVFKELLQD